MIVPRHKNKEWFGGSVNGRLIGGTCRMMHCISVMREVHLVLLGNQVQELLFLMPWWVIRNGQDKLISRNHILIPLLKIIEVELVVAQQLGPNFFGKPQRKPNLMRPHVSPPLTDP